MARLIDADALIEKCGDWYIEEGPEDGFIGTLKTLIDMQPTVDAVPVVRCKDCRHYKLSGGHCPAAETGDPRYDWTPAPNWYCADGEREDT